MQIPEIHRHIIIHTGRVRHITEVPPAQTLTLTPERILIQEHIQLLRRETITPTLSETALRREEAITAVSEAVVVQAEFLQEEVRVYHQGLQAEEPEVREVREVQVGHHHQDVGNFTQ